MLPLIKLFLDPQGDVMQYPKENTEKQGPASLSYIPFCSFIEKNTQRKMRKSEGNSWFFQTFNGKNHKTF